MRAVCRIWCTKLRAPTYLRWIIALELNSRQPGLATVRYVSHNAGGLPGRVVCVPLLLLDHYDPLFTLEIKVVLRCPHGRTA
jgi:hypothetical protein